MRDDEDAFLRPVGLVVGGLLFVALVFAAVFYARDGAVEATVEDKRCGGALAGNEVDVQTKFLGIHHTVAGLPLETCSLLRPGNFVQYHVRTQRTTLYTQEGGDCLYDSRDGVGC